MNARSIHKRLMRGHTRTFFGRRAFITVRIPREVFPPVPKFDPPGKPMMWGAAWRLPDGRILAIHDTSAGREPKPEEGKHFYFLRREGEHYWQWFEATVHTPAARHTPASPALPPEPRPVPTSLPYDEGLALVTAYKARKEWGDKYLRGMEYCEIPVLQELFDAANAAKTTYSQMTERYVYLTYSVKTAYPKRANRFCGDLSRALLACKHLGVEVRVCKGFGPEADAEADEEDDA
jgi:hypothetical protein